MFTWRRLLLRQRRTMLQGKKTIFLKYFWKLIIPCYCWKEIRSDPKEMLEETGLALQKDTKTKARRIYCDEKRKDCKNKMDLRIWKRIQRNIWKNEWQILMISCLTKIISIKLSFNFSSYFPSSQFLYFLLYFRFAFNLNIFNFRSKWNISHLWHQAFIWVVSKWYFSWLNLPECFHVEVFEVEITIIENLLRFWLEIVGNQFISAHFCILLQRSRNYNLLIRYMMIGD